MKRLLVTVFVLFLSGFFILGAIQPNKLGNEDTRSGSEKLIIHNPNIKLPEFTFYKSGQVAFTNQSLKGHWSLLFIGYTFCPDVCPTTLADLNRIYPALKNDQDTTTEVVFISVDPNRDKAEQLADYVHYFNENFIGVTGTHEQLWPLVSELGLIYSLVNEGETNEYYLVDHSASIVLINPTGQLHATFKSEVNEQGINHVNMDVMVEQIKKIQENYLFIH